MAPVAHVDVDPGICGFCCRIRATLPRKRVVRLTITGSDCEHIKQLETEIGDMSIQEVFLPLCRHPVMVAAERAGCHSACPVPTALIKAAEVALGLALPKAVSIHIRLEDPDEISS